MSQEILDKIREGLEVQIKQCIEEDGIPQQFVQSVTQSYLLLQILDVLDNINTKVAMMNIDIQDVEQAVLLLGDRQPPEEQEQGGMNEQ